MSGEERSCWVVFDNSLPAPLCNQVRVAGEPLKVIQRLQSGASLVELRLLPTPDEVVVVWVSPRCVSAVLP